MRVGGVAGWVNARERRRWVNLEERRRANDEAALCVREIRRQAHVRTHTRVCVGTLSTSATGPGFRPQTPQP